MTKREPKVCIIGAGMSGVLMGIRLKEAGIDSFRILEKAPAVGGTWQANTYPGVACDVASVYYSYSFEANPEWSHRFAPGAEIRDYLERTATKHGVLPHIQFDTSVKHIRWNGRQWEIGTSDGQADVADVVVMACGYLNQIRQPDVEGLESFKGSMFHSANWDHDADLVGKRIGLIGTGSTGTQMTAALAETGSELSVFQRTPHWILPTAFLRLDRANPRYGRPRRMIARRLPAYNRALRRLWALLYSQFADAVVIDNWKRHAIASICRRYIAVSVRDRELRRKVTPDYDVLCKRLVFASSFYRTLGQEHVSLVDAPIERIEPEGVVTRDGVLHELDALVLATGFHAHALGIEKIVGSDGTALQEPWDGGARAYKTIAYAGFPNLFHLVGPNSPVGNTSIVDVAETQTNYILQCVEKIRCGKVAALAPSAKATRTYNEALNEAAKSTVWMTGCKSWYLRPDGSLASWPWTVQQFHEALRQPDFSEFDLVT